MSNARGFTLMEVLVAMVLLSLFALVAYRALDAVLNAQRHATAKMEEWKGMAAAFALMAGDLSNAAARLDPLNPGASNFNTLLQQDGSQQLEFMRLLPDDADRGLQRTAYRCAATSLSRLVWPDINNPAGPPQEFTLLSGLRACALRYMDAEGQWLNGWQAQSGPAFPRAVELTIIEADGTPIRRVMGVQ